MSNAVLTAVFVPVILVTPQGKMLEECLSTGERLWPNPPQFLDTIAEGIKTQQVLLTFFFILILNARF